MLLRIKQRFNRNVESVTLLQKQSHQSLGTIVQQVEMAILSKTNDSVNLTSEYKMLGGANNFGFLSHTLTPNTKGAKGEKGHWVTKFTLIDMVKRESFFLQWHQAHIELKKQFAPEWLATGQLGDSTISFMVMECLDPIKSPDFQQVAELYQRCQKGKAIFQKIDSVPVLESGSRIRDVLVNLVCQFDSPNAKLFLKNYFVERKAQLLNFEKEMDEIQDTLNESLKEIGTVENEALGFVHGDFKASNMMVSAESILKLIDFQYWCYGIRVWDLAFFLSKQKTSFQKTVLVFIELLDLSEQEKKLMMFTYVIAVLLHPKSKQFKWQFKHQISPALAYLQKPKKLV